MSGKGEFLRACAAGFGFPDQVGRNWDALEEARRDVGWLTRPEYWGDIVLIDPAAPFLRAAPDDRAVARAILQSAVNHSRATPTPLTVLLRRTGGLARDLLRVAG